jgi:DnaK suppressor protein
VSRNDLSGLRDELQRRRRRILQTAHRAGVELQGLREAERDPEFEEGAQNETAQFTLTQLDETHRREVQMVDAALARMEAGVYGKCVECENEIDIRRLEALPFAIRCAECTARNEKALGRTAPPSL